MNVFHDYPWKLKGVLVTRIIGVDLGNRYGGLLGQRSPSLGTHVHLKEQHSRYLTCHFQRVHWHSDTHGHAAIARSDLEDFIESAFANFDHFALLVGVGVEVLTSDALNDCGIRLKCPSRIIASQTTRPSHAAGRRHVGDEVERTMVEEVM